MSLDVFINFRNPRKINGRIEKYWTANLTTNMKRMAKHVIIPDIITRPMDLYDILWNPHDVQIYTTTTMATMLTLAIESMSHRREELEEYNPKSGWGNYDTFMTWLKYYRDMCLKYRFCEISVCY